MTYSLYSNDHAKEEYPWRCGTYHFEVKYKGEIFYGGFKVVPKNLDGNQLNYVHEFINSHLEGLAIDYVNYKKTFSNLEKLENSSHWQFIQWFKTIESQLHQSLNMIESNSKKEMKKIYLLEKQPKHLDYESMKWENTAKGQSTKGSRFLNRKLILNPDSDSNRIVKFRISLLVKNINSTLETINEIHKEMVKQREEVVVDVRKLKSQIDKMQLSNKVTTKYIERMESALKSKEIEQREAINNIIKIENIQSYLFGSKKLLNGRLSSTFWSRIGDRPPKKIPFEKYSGYQVFQQIWNQYQNFLFPENSLKVFKLPVYRPTSELYEYYILLNVLNIIEDLGFVTYKESVREQLMSTFFESGLTDGTTVVYKKENKRVDVIYEGLVEPNDSVALEKKSYFFSSRLHRKPDIRMVLYFVENEQKKYQSTFIIEVKYRPLRNIYSTLGNTQAMDQMNDYWNITYVNDENGRRKYARNSVSHVVCVYPGDKNAPIIQNSAPGDFLQYYPIKNADDNFEIVGKKELKKLISSWLEENND